MTTAHDDIRQICLPPFRQFLDRLPALHVTGFYDDPFEPYLHQQNASKSWDTDHLTAIAGRRGGRVLDIGCGRGRVALAMAASGLSVTAVDSSRAATTRLAAHLVAHPELAARTHVVHQDFFDADGDLGEGYATAVLGDTSVNMFAEADSLAGLLHRVRSLLAPDGVFCFSVLTEAALTTYAGRNGVVATDFTDDEGRRHLLFAALRHDPAGPYFSRTLFLPDGARDDGEPVAHLAAVRERLWTRRTLEPHAHAAGFEVVDSVPAVARDDRTGRVDTQVLVLTARS
ncbi:class I SAM-dependent methyltransferase [Streptomyces sp. NPDC050546]|uniref:class I SAM-dependent methyltransferase n=1 Tax=Streptomyces sp. NPDC050546 TaxID=3365628 RepID=UPI0037B1C42F